MRTVSPSPQVTYAIRPQRCSFFNRLKSASTRFMSDSPAERRRPRRLPRGRLARARLSEECADRAVRLGVGEHGHVVDGDDRERGGGEQREDVERAVVNVGAESPAEQGEALSDVGTHLVDLTLGDDPAVEPWAPVRDQQCGHLRHPDAHPRAVARDSRLGDLEDGLPDPVAVPDAHLVVDQTVDRLLRPGAGGAQLPALDDLRELALDAVYSEIAPPPVTS
mgnify:CR=1 FL=1